MRHALLLSHAMEQGVGKPLFKEGDEKLLKSVANFQIQASMLREIDAIAAARQQSRSDVIRAAIRAGMPAVRNSA